MPPSPAFQEHEYFTPPPPPLSLHMTSQSAASPPFKAFKRLVVTVLGRQVTVRQRAIAPTRPTSLVYDMPLQTMQSRQMASTSLRSFTTKVAWARMLQRLLDGRSPVSGNSDVFRFLLALLLTPHSTTGCHRLRRQRKHPLRLQLPRQQLHRW